MVKNAEAQRIYANESGSYEVHLVTFNQVVESVGVDRQVILAVGVSLGSKGEFPSDVESLENFVQGLYDTEKIGRSDIVGISKAYVDYRNEKEKAEAEKLKAEKKK